MILDKTKNINYFSLYEELDNLLFNKTNKDLMLLKQLHKMGYTLYKISTKHHIKSEQFSDELKSSMNCLTTLCDKIYEQLKQYK